MALVSSDSEAGQLRVEEARGRSSGGVRRNLFGPVDHQQLQQDFQRLLRMTVEVASRRWDFDFHADQPLSGSVVEWEELPSQDVPAFYRSRVVNADGVAAGLGRWRGETVAGASRGSSPSSSPSSVSSEEYLELTARRTYVDSMPVTITTGVKRKQASITDFFAVKKRKLLHHKCSSRP
ncbi:cyclin-dependent kinase inhibitor 1D [Denticeps clupeoides]|uniref:Cyclin-dependent kinase inhibitor domain-containing protein n=1 Tax=Denticeps clupeoides TaxID=299321 RepID=A0AAY4EMA0_9TELE|nr:cyclin-dependent kinase inhibitor 1-like [Denticeps clupeoides]